MREEILLVVTNRYIKFPVYFHFTSRNIKTFLLSFSPRLFSEFICHTHESVSDFVVDLLSWLNDGAISRIIKGICAEFHHFLLVRLDCAKQNFPTHFRGLVSKDVNGFVILIKELSDAGLAAFNNSSVEWKIAFNLNEKGFSSSKRTTTLFIVPLPVSVCVFMLRFTWLSAVEVLFWTWRRQMCL